MKSSKSFRISAAILCASLISIASVTQTYADNTTKGHAAEHSKMETSKDMTDGEVRKVDKDSAKLTIKHGEIKSLDMPPMTMVFQVKEKAMLDKVQAGDKIKFKVVNDHGKMIVTEIQSAK